jgi:hypothetical protein
VVEWFRSVYVSASDQVNTPVHKRSILNILAWAFLLNLLPVSFASTEKPATRNHPSRVRIPVWVKNASGEFQMGLTVRDFQVYDGKQSLKISDLQNRGTPALLFIALDTVGDMAKVDQARSALKQEVETLGSQYWVGVLSAQERLEVLQDPTPIRELVQQKLDMFSQIGKAGLLESIQKVAEFSNGILQQTRARVGVIFVTDSDIGNYRQDYLNPPVNYSDSRDLSRRFAGRALQEKISKMTIAMARYHAPIFIVHIDPAQDPLNQSYQNGLKQLAEASGGQLFLSKTAIDIPTMIQEAFRWACNFYVLDFQVPPTSKDTLKIRVNLAGNSEGATAAGRLTYASRLLLKK